MSKDNTNLSPSGLGLGSYQHVIIKRTGPVKDPAKGDGEELTGGTLNGTQWADVESKKVLYEFARDEGLDVSSRDNKATIVSILSAATKAKS